jgi:hypothetical protein
MIVQALEGFRLTVEETGDGLRVVHGAGRDARVAEVCPGVVSAEDCVAYAAGVKAALGRPVLTAVSSWEFTEVAGRLVPTVERLAFQDGFRDGGGGAPWERPFGGAGSDLCVHYYVELDRGHQLLTKAQVGTWGVTDDRITSASRSLLYHKTMQGEPARHESGLECYGLRDGYDASRALILPDLDYHRTRAGVLVAVPSPHLLLFADVAGGLGLLSTVAAEEFAAAKYPLSRRLFAWRSPQVFEVCQ